MRIFQQNKNQLNSLKEKPFKLEKEIQKIVESNLAVSYTHLTLPTILLV